MIIILHGEDIKSSREYFFGKKQTLPQARTFSGESLSLTDLTQILEGGELFSEEKQILIENFFGKKSKETEILSDFLTHHEKDATIIIWENKELTKKDLTLFPKADVRLFKFPQTLFAFLEGIVPNSSRNIILFHNALKQTACELLFFMLIRQFRLLLAVSSSHPEHSEGSIDSSLAERDQNDRNIDEAARMAPWQKTKLTRQSRQFAVKQLKDAYSKLYTIELQQKTGQLPMSLEKTIDIFLLSL